MLVNRLWKLFFGQGLVRTLDDFGTQGALPTHPELLDWLAVEFVDSGWDVKHMVKLMVMSRTYRQIVAEHAASCDRVDPTTTGSPGRAASASTPRWSATTPWRSAACFRLRQSAGRSVKPYQPAGYWSYLNFPVREWQNDHGENQYRRGLYTYWQRTFLHPSLLAFDASTREECTVERPRSNTPLQALVLLNDPTYVEASRVFAARIVREGGSTDAGPAAIAPFARRLQRDPTTAECRSAAGAVSAAPGAISSRPEGGRRSCLNVGDARPSADVDPAELAAWTSVAGVLLNLHETITREIEDAMLRMPNASRCAWGAIAPAGRFWVVRPQASARWPWRRS